jgi:hypothetical protein
VQLYNSKGFQLTYVNYDTTLNSLNKRLANTFFTVYPQLAASYNNKTARKITMIIDTAYKGVAETSNDIITISSAWMHKHPEDIDVITHEVMHIVQNYGESTGPGWLTEGIADYVRYKFGVNNQAANWSLPAYKAGQDYTNSYRITARFLVWLEKNVKPGIVKIMDEQLRQHTFNAHSWQQQTGKNIDELWREYAVDPAI